MFGEVVASLMWFPFFYEAELPLGLEGNQRWRDTLKVSLSKNNHMIPLNDKRDKDKMVTKSGK